MTGPDTYIRNDEPSLTQQYAEKLSANDWQTDPAQQLAINRLDTLRRALIEYHAARNTRRWWHLDEAPTAPRGLYLWGGVGRGKTFMMDLFFESLPIPATRSHFHRFMYDVHTSLKQLDGRRDPLPEIAKTLASRVSVLCFDEFFVSDIADAMLLGRLTTALFELGVVLVATSNQPPDDLYKDGLQRARFLPAIDQIKLHCDILHVDHAVDYRLRLLDQAPMYYTPSDDETNLRLQERFQKLSEGGVVDEPSVEINGRTIPVIAKAPGVCWFSFDALCRGPRSQN
ncbi:MAG: cell division protein ZapE, partial [Pseudomonadota bacterium]